MKIPRLKMGKKWVKISMKKSKAKTIKIARFLTLGCHSNENYGSSDVRVNKAKHSLAPELDRVFLLEEVQL